MDSRPAFIFVDKNGIWDPKVPWYDRTGWCNYMYISSICPMESQGPIGQLDGMDSGTTCICADGMVDIPWDPNVPWDDGMGWTVGLHVYVQMGLVDVPWDPNVPWDDGMGWTVGLHVYVQMGLVDVPWDL